MNKKTIYIIFLSALLITILFHRQSLGLNLVIFEFIFLGYLLFSKQLIFKKKNATYTLLLVITVVSTIFTHSIFSYIMHFIILIIFIGALIFPNAKSCITNVRLSIVSIINSQIKFISNLSDSELQGQKIRTYLWQSRIFVVPLLIILFFVVIYRGSNPVFNDIFIAVNTFFSEKLSFLFKGFDFLLILTFAIALFLSNYFFIRTSNINIINNDINASYELKRKKQNIKRNSRFIALKNEYKSGVFLFLILNLILLLLNIIEVKWVWFNFEWEGQYLKDFVHQGVYLLILSIVISIGLVLYFFRGNINFYKKNRFLKWLSYVWLVQNAMLIVSVAIRNYWYIYYFSLAYKRIGVFIFLILVAYGLYSVFLKVRDKKSTFYLMKTNAFVIVLVLTLSSFVNWDNVIAEYNFKHSDRAFLHLDFLSTLSDKALPYLDKDMGELSRIDNLQKKKFLFDEEYMNTYEFKKKIEKRKLLFFKKWEKKGFLSWNFPEYIAYKKLK